MSYPGYKYSSYIGQPNNDQQAYNRVNPPSTAQRHQQTPTQYAQQSPYDWSQHNHQSTYGNAASPTYDSTAWKSEQDRSYHYSQSQPQPQLPQVSSYNTSTSVASNGYHATAGQQSPTSTNALNSLAYASGLESAGMGNGGTQPATGYNAARQQAPERVASPYDQNQPRRSEGYGMNRPPSAASRPPQSQGQPRYQTQTQQPVNALLNEQTQPVTQFSNYRTSLGNQVASSASQRKTQSPTMAHTTTSSQGSGNRVKASTPVARPSQPASSRWNPPQPAQSQSHSRAPSMQGNNQTPQLSTDTAASTITSTFRSVMNSGPAPYGASNEYANPISPPPSAMPSYIDPSQVYNPYQQEYEKRKAAEEAEAVRLAAEQKEKGRLQEEEMQRRKKSTPAAVEPAKEKKRSRKSAPNPQSEATKATDHRRRSEDSAALQAAAFLSSGMGSAGDDVTMDEMQLMLQKIQQMKSKDPSKFQQLLGALTDDQPVPGPANTGTPQQPAPVAAGPISSYNATPRPESTPRADSTSKSASRAEKNFHYQLPADNPENLPDLGKFPVLRRMRNKLHATQDAPSDDLDRVLSTGPASPPRPVSSRSQPGTSSGAPAAIQDQSASNFKFPTPTNLKFQSSLGPVHVSSAPSISAQKTSSPQIAKQISQPQPSTGGASNKAPPPTVWPQAKRTALAEAAVRTLLLNPHNRDKGLTPSIILDLLELNPSYPELCEKLEARGITLHRGNFAKSLLQSVPDLASSSQPAANAPSLVSPTTQASKLQGAPLRQPGAQAVAQLNTSVANNASYGSPVIPIPEIGSFNWKPTAVPGQTFVPGPTPTQRHRSRPQPQPQPPPPQAVPLGPKEAQARKRDFSDIVDLTQSLDGDETEVEDEPPQKEPRLENPNINPNIDPRLYFHKPASPSLPMKSSGPTLGSNAPSDIQKEEVARRSRVRANGELVQRVKKGDALRRSNYNILTIARDVLLASGRHPTEAPLNAHLARLTTRLPQINYEADLSTLRWDLLDPGGPPVFQDESTRIAPNQRFTSSGTGANSGGLTAAQLNLMKVASKQREKREGEKPQSSLRNVVNLTSDLGSDRSSVARSSVVEVQVPRRAVSPAPPIPGSKYKSTPRNAIRPTNAMPPAESGPKRRGRPPGAKNKNPLKSQQLKQAAGVVIQVPRRPKDGHRQRSPQPEPISYSTYDCRWQGCQAKLHNLETLRKHFAKVHHYSYDHNTCLWEDCGTEDEIYDKPSNSYETVQVPLKFNSRDDWSNHIVGAHLDPIGWSLGEGPSIRSNDSSSTSVPTYLLDDSGRLVTPIIKANSNRPHDTMHFVKPTLESERTIDRKGLVAFNKVHGNNTPQDKAKEVLRAVERKKATIGALVDRGGCTMVNRDNRHILEVGGDVKIVRRADDWLYEGRDREADMDTQESDEF